MGLEKERGERRKEMKTMVEEKEKERKRREISHEQEIEQMKKMISDSNMTHDQTITLLQQTAKEANNMLLELQQEKVSQIESSVTFEKNQILIMNKIKKKNELEI